LSFDWIVEDQVAAMSAPWPDQLRRLAEIGVTAVISLTERVPRGLPHPQMAHLHLPVRDFSPPTPKQMETAVSFIIDRVAEGGAVAVHCTAGLGRSGTIVSAWLVSRGMSAAEAINAVRRRRPGSVETREQELAIARFEDGFERGEGS
jgi:atypical dual specificity phosphatase